MSAATCKQCGKELEGAQREFCSIACGNRHRVGSGRSGAVVQTEHGHALTVRRRGGESRWSCRREGCGWEHRGELRLEVLEAAPCEEQPEREEAA